MEKIEYSVDDGETWIEVMYESVNGSMSTYESFQFQFVVDTDLLPEGYNMIIVRGVDDTGASSMISWDTVLGGGNLESMGSGESLGRMLFIIVFGFAVMAFGAWVAIQKRVDEPFELAYAVGNNDEIPSLVNDEPLEATLIEEADGTSS
jgi:hypothetical protein